MKTISLFMTIAVAQMGNLLAQDSSDATTSHTKRVAFAQSCFWTGEMKLGQIEGVVRTEAGFFKGREVTLVEYAPERITLEDLARQAKEAGVADSVHVEPGVAAAVPGVARGAPLDQSYRPAPASDQKKQIDGTPFSRLQLSP